MLGTVCQPDTQKKLEILSAGAQYDLACAVSLNIETPGESNLAKLSKKKRCIRDIIEPMKLISRLTGFVPITMCGESLKLWCEFFIKNRARAAIMPTYNYGTLW